MKTTELIERVLERHEFTVAITGPWGERVDVHVVIPDLRSAARSVWGDWGPMYTVSLPPERKPEVSVRLAMARTATREVLELPRLQIDSPMAARTRRVTPLVMKLPISERGVALHVSYDTRGRPASAEVVPLPGASEGLAPYRVEVEQASDRSRLSLGSGSVAPPPWTSSGGDTPSASGAMHPSRSESEWSGGLR